MIERALAVACLAGALLVSLALTGAFQPAHLPGAFGAQYCPADQYGSPTGDCLDDTTPPLISSTVTPGPNANGWNNTNVTLVFNATDESGGSGVRSINCNLGGTTDGATRGIVFTASTVNTDVTCTAMDWAGNVSDPATRSIRIDKNRPTIGVGIKVPAPDLYGWNTSDVTVTWPCGDAFSGTVSPTVSRTVTTNGQFQSATGTCADLAGNQTSGTVGGINIDKTVTIPTGGPPNDNIANATVVSSLPFSASADTTTATRETHEPICTSPADDQTVWYTLTATQPGLVKVSLTGSAPTTPVISVWRPGSSGLQFVSCRIAIPAGSSTFTAQTGVTYYIRIGGITGPGPAGAGPFEVEVDVVPPPPNDSFANAKPIGSLPFSDALDLTAATVEPGEPLHPGGSLSPLTRTAWYRFTPAKDELVVLGGTTVLSSVSTMAVFTGSTLATLRPVVATTQVVPQGNTSFLFPLVFQALGGTTYSIQAGTFVFPVGNDVATIGLEQPIVYLGQAPPPNANGWNNTDVTLSWHCSTLIPFVPPTATQTLTFDGFDESATGFCSGPFGGSASDTERGVDIDKTPPSAPTATPDRAPDFAGGGGWYADVVTVGFTDNGDSGSGVDPASIPAPVAFATDGPHTASGTVEDLAGNVSAPGTLGVQVDATAPDLSVALTKADGSTYVQGTRTNEAVTATFSCSDGGSGVASTTPPQTVSAQGANQSVTGSCTDNVGHVTTQTFGGIDIDLTPPEASIRFDPASLDVVVTGTDQGGSGIDPGPVAPAIANGKGGGQVRTYTLTDGAGNTLVLVLQAKADTGSLQATVTSLRYDGGPLLAAPFTALVYTWTTAKDGSLKTLDQTLTVGKGAAQQFVDASFDASKNQTKITGSAGASTVPGLDLLRVATSAGALAIQT